MALEAGKLALWVWNAQSGRIEWTGDVEAVLGGTIDRYDGSLTSVSDAVVPEDRALLQDAIEQALVEGDGGGYRVDFRVRRSDGSVRWVRSIGRVERRRDGSVTALLGAIQDVTDAKRDEEMRGRFIEQIILAVDAERQRVARELHDGLGQSLTSLLMGLGGLEGELTDAGRERLGRLRGLASQSIEEVKQVARRLHPWILDDLGFGVAVERLVEEHRMSCGLAIDLHLRGLEERLPRDLETALYRILQEALANVVKHAAAHTVSIIVERTSQVVNVIVEDDGGGFDVARTASHEADLRPPEGEASAAARCPRVGLGLQSMRGRAAALGGELTVESSPGAGTSLYVKIPLAAPRDRGAGSGGG